MNLYIKDMEKALQILDRGCWLSLGPARTQTWEMSAVCSSHFHYKWLGSRNTGDTSPSHNYLGRNDIASSIINSLLIHSLFLGCSHTCFCKNEHSIMVCYLVKMRPKMLSDGCPHEEPCFQTKRRLGKALGDCDEMHKSCYGPAFLKWDTNSVELCLSET